MKLAAGGIEFHLSRGVLILALLCLLALGYVAYDYHDQTRLIDDTEKVEATVLNVDVAEDGGTRRTTDYRPVVEYEYEYGGSTYTSDNVYPGSFEQTYEDESEARAVLEPYEVGNTTIAHVDTSDPETAFLQEMTTDQPIWYGALVIAVLVLTVLHAIGPRDVGCADLRPAERIERRRYETVFGVDRDAVYTYSKRYAVRSAAAVFGSLALFALTILVTFLREGSTVFVDADPLGPFGLPLVATFLAYIVFVGSMLVYTVWSFTEYRRLRDRMPEPKPPSPFRHPSRLITITEHSVRTDEMDTYGDRVRWTGLAVAFCFVLVGWPVLSLLVA